MSTGEVLRVRAAMKPISTIPKALRTVDVVTGEAAPAINQRSDVCAVPAAGVVAEAMVLLVLADAMLEKFGGDTVDEVTPQPAGLPRQPHRPLMAPVVRPDRIAGGRQVHRSADGWPRLCGVPFVDTDKVIEAETGMAISDIFVDLGRGRLPSISRRTRSRRPWRPPMASWRWAAGPSCVPRPRTRLAGHRVVWLKVSLHDAAQRVGMNQARPLLLGNVRGTLAALLEKREPVYAAVSTDVVDTSGRSVKQVADDVVKAVRGE